MKLRKGCLYRRGKIYYLKYTVNGKVFRESLGTSKLHEALAAQSKIMDGIRTGDEIQVLHLITARLAVERAAAREIFPVATAWQTYLASPGRPDSGPATLDQYHAEWKRFAAWLAGTPGIKTLAQVSDRMAQDYARTLSGVSASTFNQHIGLLRLIWRVLGVEPSPWRTVRRRRASRDGRRELTAVELKTVIGSATGELRKLLLIGLYTGLRLGDACQLRHEDIIDGVIRIIPAKTARSGRTVTIPVHPALATAIGKGKGNITPASARLYRRNRSDLVQQIREHFESCGIATTADRGGLRKSCLVGFHSLRHTFVSMCRVAGAPLAVVEAIVGHSNPAMTRHYTHIGDDAARAAVSLLPRV
jgi:integrase